MAGTLHIQLLGIFRLLHDDVPLNDIDTPRLQSFLAYLLMHRAAPQSRSYLSFVFWPDSTESQARTNLRKQLHHLRQALPDADYYIHADSNTIHWQAQDRFTLDVDEMARALDESEQAQQAGATGAQRAALDRAVLLYEGDLLPSCYDDWIFPERERLRRRAISALEHLAGLLEEVGTYGEATRHVRHMLRLDPLHEQAYRQLMHLLALQGNRAEAIRTYHTCATTLDEELGIEPSAVTQQLYRRLLEQDAADTKPANSSRVADKFLSAWPLVGRDIGWAQLQAAWQNINSNGRHLVLVTGEAGIGKTRLAEEFVTWARRQGISTAVARCYMSGQGLAYGPVADWLRSDALKQPLHALDPVWLGEIARVLPQILVDHPDIPHPQPMTEPWQRQHLFEAMALPFDRQRRVVLLIDDVHWADHETIEWLSYLLHRDSRAGDPLQLLIVATARVEELPQSPRLQMFIDELHHTDQLSEIQLDPLTGDESLALANSVASQPIPPDLAAILYTETEGNPLFVVETVRAALSTKGDGARMVQAADEHANLPPAVHSAVVSRLAHLSPEARSLAEVGATLGRQFAFDVLVAASSNDGESMAEDTLVRALDELWQRHIVRQSGTTDYDFAHDKIRHVVYDGLSPVRRRQLHQRVAHALVEVHGDSLDAQSGQIAGHYERGGLQRQAIDYYRRAAAVARRIYANDEAIGLYSHLLNSDLSAALREDEACAIMLELGAVWQLTGDWPAAQRIYRQALAMAEAADNRVMCARCHFSLGNLVRQQGEYDDALQWLSMARDGFESTGEKHGLVRALWAIGEVYWYKGDHARALEALERQMEIARDQGDRRGMCDAAGTMGIVYWSLGEFKRAREFCLQSIEIAKEIDHWWGVGRALVTLGNTHNNEGNLAPAFAAYEQAFEVGRQIGDRQCVSWALSNMGHIYHLADDDQSALTCYRLGLHSALGLGDRWVVSIALANMAKVTASLGDTGKAKALYEKAITLARTLGANYLGEYILSFSQFYEQQGLFEQARRYNDQVAKIADGRSSEHMGGVNTRFSSRLLAIKLDYALGDKSRVAAIRDMEALLSACESEVERARIRYEMWQLDPTDEGLRRAAADLYLALNPSDIRGDHRKRYALVTGEEEPALPILSTPDKVVGEVPANDDVSLSLVDDLLTELDSAK